jgi:hypothetical protein
MRCVIPAMPKTPPQNFPCRPRFTRQGHGTPAFLKLRQRYEHMGMHFAQKEFGILGNPLTRECQTETI